MNIAYNTYQLLIILHYFVQACLLFQSDCSAGRVLGLCDLGCQGFCIVIELQLRSGPCHDNVPNLALLLKSRINACFKSLTWSAIQTCTGLTGLPWLSVISCRVLQAQHAAGEQTFSTISASPSFSLSVSLSLSLHPMH